MPSANASLPLSRTPQGMAVATISLEGGRVATPSLHALRPAPTARGGLSAVLRDVQGALPKPVEVRLLQQLDQPRRPPPAFLSELWKWASPDEAGTTVLDELGLDRCALMCSLWTATSQREVQTALQRGDRAVVELLLRVVHKAAGRPTDAKTQAQARATEARLDAAEVYLARTNCPPRRRLGVLLLAHSAPPAGKTQELTAALAEADALVDTLAPDLDDVRLLAQRAAVAVGGRPVARAALRQLLPVFLQACWTLATVVGGRSAPEEASGLMAQLSLFLAQPDEAVRAFARDARRLPWSSDPALVRARCVCALFHLGDELREAAMMLVCARGPRQALQKAACSGQVPGPEQPEALALVRRATLCAAFSICVGAAFRPGARADAAPDPNHTLALLPEEFLGLSDGRQEKILLQRTLGTMPNGARAAGMRVLNAHAGIAYMHGPLALLLIHAAAERPEPLDGQQMLTLIELCNTVVLQGPASEREDQVRYGLLLRLVLAQLPDVPDRLRPVLRALLSVHSCSTHPKQPTFAQAQETVEFIGRILDQTKTAGARTLLCLTLAEATAGLGCRHEAQLIAERVSRLDASGWEALLSQAMTQGTLMDCSTHERLARIEDVAALHPAEEVGVVAGRKNGAPQDAAPATSAQQMAAAGDEATVVEWKATRRTLDHAADAACILWDALRLAEAHGAGAGAGASAARSRRQAHELAEQATHLVDAAAALESRIRPADKDANAVAGTALHRRLAEVAATAHQLERRELALVREPAGAGSVAGRRAATLAAVAAKEAEAALVAEVEGGLPGGQLGALRTVAGIEKTLGEARELAAAAAQQRSAVAVPPPPAPAATPTPMPDAAVVAREGDGEVPDDLADTDPRVLPGPRGYIWHPAASRSETVDLTTSLPPANLLLRLRHTLWRELRRHSIPALRDALENRAAHLAAWLSGVGHTSADHALQPGELDEVRAAATAMQAWRNEHKLQPVDGFAVRLAAALVWQQLDPVPAGPYWAGDGGRARHYRALFGVIAGLGCTQHVCRQMHLSQLARLWVQARRGTLYGWDPS